MHESSRVGRRNGVRVSGKKGDAMEWLGSNPFVPVIAISAATAAVFAVAIAWTQSRALGAIAAPVVFLVAYYLTYQKIPPFPPAGAANKVFYVGLIAALGAIALDALPRDPVPAWAKAALAALLGVLWIGSSQWGHADLQFVAMSLALLVGGALALWIPQVQNSDAGGAAALSMFAALGVLLAPVSLFGGSSTGVGLCLGAAAGLAALSIAYLRLPRALPNAAMLSVGAGLLALVDAISLISRRADPWALALVAVAPLVGRHATRLLPETARRRALQVWLVSGLATLSPIVVIVALLFWRHESPL